MTTSATLFINRGDSFQINGVAIIDGVITNVTDATITLGVARSEGSIPLFSVMATLTSPVEGEYEIVVPSTLTRSLDKGSYFYEIRVVDGGVEVVLNRGSLVVSGSILAPES